MGSCLWRDLVDIKPESGDESDWAPEHDMKLAESRADRPPSPLGFSATDAF